MEILRQLVYHQKGNGSTVLAKTGMSSQSSFKHTTLPKYRLIPICGLYVNGMPARISGVVEIKHLSVLF